MTRLDSEIYKRGLSISRSIAEGLVERGGVLVNGKKVTKRSFDVSESDLIEITETQKYVGRGGEKLEHALSEWKINLNDLIALDIGSSTGGFVDCALQNGVSKIFAVDVGTDQLDSKLRSDSRVEVMEKTDIRKVTSLSPVPDIAFVDVSFISLTLVLPHAFRLIKPKAKVIALVKPQFEVGREIAQKHKGVIRDEAEQKTAFDRVKSDAKNIGFKILGETDSPIYGGDGNKEFLLLLSK